MMFVSLRNIVFILFLAALAGCTTLNGPPDKKDKVVSTAQTNIQLGMAYLEKKDVQRAKEKLLAAVTKAPNLPEGWYSMAYFYEITGNNPQAQQYYLKAIELAPRRGDTQNNYGTYLCRTGDYNGAIQHFMLAVQDPAYLDTAGAFENAGLCALKIPDLKVAMQYLSEAEMQDPNRPSTLLELAKLYFKQGDYVVARQKLDLYLIIAPPTPQSIALNQAITQKIGAPKKASSGASGVSPLAKNTTKYIFIHSSYFS